uniref:Uncharacterized protein n=1 Tax=Chrysotila carterae TaxID=13221 RepID=A0A7S4ETG3_CHRCT
MLIHRHAQRELCSYPFFDCDIRWTPRATIIWPTICVAAGLVAGMFGIGGGIVKGPLMLEMGMQPAVSSATSAYMILFTSATAATQYFIFGALRLRYGAVMFVVGFCGTVVGQMGVSYLLKRWGRQSIIVIVIAVVIGFSCLMMGAVGTFDFIQGIRAGEYQGFHALCA